MICGLWYFIPFLLKVVSGTLRIHTGFPHVNENLNASPREFDNQGDPGKNKLLTSFECWVQDTLSKVRYVKGIDHERRKKVLR